MDLLCNYGSDEEDDEQVPTSVKSVLSLPPPRASSDRQVDRELSGKEASGQNGGHKPATAKLPSNFFDTTNAFGSAEKSALPLGFFDTNVPFSDVDDSTKVNGRSGLFAKLPPPSSTTLGLSNLPPPSNLQLKKKVVEFKVPVNLSVLDSTVENEEERKAKRPKASYPSAPAPGVSPSLAALLPPPKNSLGSGLAFGGGGLSGGGRRTAMETVTSSSPAPGATSVTKDGLGRMFASPALETTARVNVEPCHPARPSMAVPGVSLAEVDVREPGGNSVQYQQSSSDHFFSSGYGEYNCGSGCSNGWQHPQSSGAWEEAPPTATNGGADLVADALQRERKKGRNEPPVQFIEVKQADLTGGRLREDQIGTTGIAFGPKYQPVSTGKDKPSKLHRRKHQIGALYFDMKSKEMELLDRRSRGNLTKAETQAKYGW